MVAIALQLGHSDEGVPLLECEIQSTIWDQAKPASYVSLLRLEINSNHVRGLFQVGIVLTKAKNDYYGYSIS